jgi:transposase
MAHVRGQSRDQLVLFGEALDDLVAAEAVVRVIDAFVDGLDLAALGFRHVAAEATGRPPYHPGDLLKLYVYGYLNQLRSSRKLGREACRNVELLWLTRRVCPKYKTIADFRKDHVEAIVGVCRAFIGFCRGQGLVEGQVLAIDGSKIEAYASRKQVMTPQRIARMQAAIEAKIAAYLAAMDEADATEKDAIADPQAVKAALAALQDKRATLTELAGELSEQDLTHKVMSEPEARLMRTARSGHQVAYNAQAAVDAKPKLIVAFDLVTDGNDQTQLYHVAEAGRQAIQASTLTVVADTGYSSGAEGEACARSGITAIVPRPQTVNPRGEALFSRERFTYDAPTDSWRCPAGQTLARRKTSATEKKVDYWSNACSGCDLKSQCTKATKRVIVRSFFEEAREAMHQRAMADAQWLKLRRETVEHPFAGLKWLMGRPRFLLKGLAKAKGELGLLVLSYNLKRVSTILGVPALLKALQPLPG